MRRTIYGLLQLALAGGLLLGLMIERHGQVAWPLITLMVLLATMGLIQMVQCWILQPIDDLVHRVERLQHGDYHQSLRRLPVQRGDEIGRLARAVHGLCLGRIRHRHEADLLRRTLDDRVQHATKAATAQLRLLVQRDPLTSLGNRRFMQEQLPQLFEAVRQSNQSMTCMAIDIDDFKQINDQLGHAAGDAALLQLSTLLRAVTRESDIAVRLGGDEFVLWLPGLESRCAAELAQTLGKLFAQQMQFLVDSDTATPDTALSIGIADSRQDPVETAEQLLALADHRLYQAKCRGKNRVEIGTPSANA